jgi:ethanolamine transporter
MLPAFFIISKLLDKPLHKMGEKLGINSVSALALLGSLVTNASSFGVVDKMDKKGVVLNAAFAVSASFVFGSHLACTMVYNQDYILPMIVGKIVSGIAAVVLAILIYKDKPEEAAE